MHPISWVSLEPTAVESVSTQSQARYQPLSVSSFPLGPCPFSGPVLSSLASLLCYFPSLTLSLALSQPCLPLCLWHARQPPSDLSEGEMEVIRSLGLVLLILVAKCFLNPVLVCDLIILETLRLYRTSRLVNPIFVESKTEARQDWRKREQEKLSV